jgi:cyclic pyranopterin phosphate synthase
MYMGKKKFTHFDSSGSAIMVDVSAKEITFRTAAAKGRIAVNKETLEAIKDGSAKKGDVLGAARLAGIMGAKKTSELIPLCHPLGLDTCTVDFELPDAADSDGLFRIEASCAVKLSGKTGAEMEALTGVSTALLTIYDMCKALNRAMVISDIRLEEKSGGRSGPYKRKQ